jgi:inner membrane protein YidH
MVDAQKSIARTGEKVADSAVQIERSTKEVEASTERVEDSADRRTVLAGDRTVLAAERTYAAWVRTGLVALASGIGAKKLLSGILPEVMIVATGSLLVMFAAFCFVAGVWRDLNPVSRPPRPEAKSLPPALLVVVNGFLALVALSALVGIWFGRSGEIVRSQGAPDDSAN